MTRTKSDPRTNASFEMLATEIGGLRTRLKQMERAMQGMAQQQVRAGGIVAAEARDPFITSRRRRKRGEFVTMAFSIPANAASLKVIIIADKDNPAMGATPAQITEGRARVIEGGWDDINDEERAAGVLEREFPTPLDFLTKYGLLRIIAKDENGNAIKNPADSPFLTAPFPYLNNLTFTTCNEDGSDCGGEIAVVIPRPDPNGYVVESEVTNKGVLPTFSFIVPRTARSVRVRLAKTKQLTASPQRLDRTVSYRWEVNPSELTTRVGLAADERVFKGQFPTPLTFNTEYQTIRVVIEGENVGGRDVDKKFNPDVLPSPATGIAGGTFTAGASITGTNADLGIQTPFIDLTVDPTTGLPKGYEFRKRGLRPIMNFKIPAATTSLRCRIIRQEDFNANRLDLSIEDLWEDISDAERSSKLLTRKFGKSLDYVATYHVIRIVAKGDNVGGDDVDTAKVPSAGPAILATFTTPNEDGVSVTPGGALSFGSPFPLSQRTTKRGVFVKFRLNIPRTMRRVTIKLGATADSNDKSKSLEYIIEDIDDAERATGVIDREFGHRLDNNTEYGVIRLIGEGENVNAGGVGGANPDIFRNPKIQPTIPLNYVDNGGVARRFVTGAEISFPGATSIPSIPTSADIIINTLEGDPASPKIFVRIYASSFRNGGNAGGTATDVAGGVAFRDVGLDAVFAVINPATESIDGEKLKPGGPISDANLDKTFVDIEVTGTRAKEMYTWKRSVGTSGDRRSVAITPSPISFRAGGDINLSQLTLSILSAQVADPEDRRSSVLTYQYNIFAQSLLFRNIIVSREIQRNPPQGYIETDRLTDRDLDTADFTAGLHTKMSIVPHPKKSNVRYKVRITGLRGSNPAFIEALFPPDGSFINVGDEPAFTDPDRPLYSPGKSPRMKFRWKPTGLKVRIDLPDLNMNTFKTVKIAFIVVAFNPVSGTQQIYLNPNFPATDGNAFLFSNASVDVNNSPFAIEVGQLSDKFFPYDRPNIDGSGEGANGDVPDTVMNVIRSARNNGGSAYILCEMYIFNRAPVFSPYLTVFSQQIFFDNGDADNRAFEEVVSENGVS